MPSLQRSLVSPAAIQALDLPEVPKPLLGPAPAAKEAREEICEDWKEVGGSEGILR